MKSELTIAIENRLFDYSPDTTGGMSINKFRTSHIGYEVPVTTGTTADGLIDCVRIDEILINGSRSRGCSIGGNPEWYKKNHPTVLNYVNCKKGIDSLDEFPEYCEEEGCPTSCILRSYDNEIAVTCYEIKISKEDFHSPNGHNFCGNANYYVMPETLYKTVKNEISEDIGVIIYKVTDKTETLRRVKECVWKPLDAETQRWMILNVMKKQISWRHRSQIEANIKYLHNMMPKECITCDFNTDIDDDCPYKESCIIATNNPEHSAMWECKDSEFLKCGIILGRYEHYGEWYNE